MKLDRREIDPVQIFGLPQIEIVDISRNKITEVPDEIEHLKALRVFSIQYNDVKDLPFCLANITTLRMLKVTGNPLNPVLQRIIDDSDSSPTQSNAADENVRDTMLTRKLTEYMRQSGDDSTYDLQNTFECLCSNLQFSSDGPLETPRALSRFPVQPQYSHSTSGSESASDLRSPGFSRPSLPSRSHTRIPSSQYGTLQMAAPRRPGLAPLALGNERNRSNSESILQSTQNPRMKRMGLVTKKNNDLGVLNETQSNQDSYHLRGQSHGSALRHGIRAEDSSPSGGSSGGELQQSMLGRRLTHLQVQRQEAPLMDPLTESFRSALYSINMLLPLTSTLANFFTRGESNRPIMERHIYSAAMQIEHLDRDLVQLDSSLGQHSVQPAYSGRTMLQAAYGCISIHQRATEALSRIAAWFVKDADPRFLRLLMLTMYGSTSEMSNAKTGLVVYHVGFMAPKNIQRISTVSTISESSNEGNYTYISDRSATPTQHRKPGRRWKSGSTIHQQINHPDLPTPGAQTAIPLFAGGRSRSNSRPPAMYSSASSSLISTPHSSDFSSSASWIARSHSCSLNTPSDQLPAERQEAVQFERIYSVLSNSVREGFSIIPQLQSDFLHALEDVDKQYGNSKLRDQWIALADSAAQCSDVTQALRARLSTIRLNDNEAPNVQSFWQLAKRFLDAYGDLLLAIKEAIKQNLIDPNMRHRLRTIHSSTREAARLIGASPWHRLILDVDPQAIVQAPTQLQIQPTVHNEHQHRTRGSGGSTAGGSSPYTANIPATPLSAALGPAAKATIPVTPGTASLERSFEGDIFQRADTYQSLQQTVIPRRQLH